MKHNTTAPVSENSIARIGPVEVQVGSEPRDRRRGAGDRKADDKAGIQWWNGEKWSSKKGPARKRAKAKSKA